MLESFVTCLSPAAVLSSLKPHPLSRAFINVRGRFTHPPPYTALVSGEPTDPLFNEGLWVLLPVVLAMTMYMIVL